jgi:DNA-binding transcriptional regulator/RsmH inhibitor MraZ
MDEVTLRFDSKGRICLPAEIRKELGDVVVLKKTPEGYLIVPFQEWFRKIIKRKPRRTGKPKFLSPEEMKKIWEPKV